MKLKPLKDRVLVSYTEEPEKTSGGLYVPDTAKELALIVDDPDAPTPQPWVHWIIYKIPTDWNETREGVAKVAALPGADGVRQGKNSWGNVGYGGPAPPRGHGVHHYHFKLYALDARLAVTGTLDKNELLAAMEGHIITQADLVGTYER